MFRGPGFEPWSDCYIFSCLDIEFGPNQGGGIGSSILEDKDFNIAERSVVGLNSSDNHDQ